MSDAVSMPMATSKEIAASYEARLLGSLLHDPTQIDSILELVGFDDFTDSLHRAVFMALVSIHDSRDPVHITSVHEQIVRTQAMTSGSQQNIGLPFLQKLMNDAGPIGARADATKVRQRSALRALHNMGERVIELSSNATALPDAILEEAQTTIVETAKIITARGPVESTLVPIQRVMEPYLNGLIARGENPDVIDGMRTGLHDVDSYLDFLGPGYHVLAARPGVGKTAMAIQFALNGYVVSEDGGETPIATAYMSTEMPEQVMAQRALANEARVNIHHLRSGRMSDEDLPRIIRAYERIIDLPWLFDSTRGLTTDELRSRVRRFDRERKTRFGLVIVDYLQNVVVPEHVRLGKLPPAGYVSQVLGDLARAHPNLIFLVLAACNREQDKRANKRPVMADIRDSGNVESDADSVSFLHNDDNTPGIIEMIFRKNREGAKNHTIDLAWSGETQRFSDTHQRTHEEREAASAPPMPAQPPRQAQRDRSGRDGYGSNSMGRR